LKQDHRGQAMLLFIDSDTLSVQRKCHPL